ncbi:hypothetical protein EPI10_020482 [Gossypium australe]|uniref:Uncharacterized protein n=1 Tax=Gossypium australe TaxID=47621 RepID=A0A5B6WFS6_9ROSI|nr:hypothetical protein EPI10_020482 [Gossypium australe]
MVKLPLISRKDFPKPFPTSHVPLFSPYSVHLFFSSFHVLEYAILESTSDFNQDIDFVLDYYILIV